MDLSTHYYFNCGHLTVATFDKHNNTAYHTSRTAQFIYSKQIWTPTDSKID